MRISGKTVVAGVAGRPIAHSLSPLLHNAWLEAAGIDAVYTAFSPPETQFPAFIDGLRGGVIRGLNVTLPFKEAALKAADEASLEARTCGAANLLIFHPEGRIEARNTDGEGLLYAFTRQTPWLRLAKQPIAIIGAGGAARGAVAILHAVGVPDIRVVNRTLSKAQVIADDFDGASAWALSASTPALDGVGVIINATSAEVGGENDLGLRFAALARGAVAMDMLYRPLKTGFLARAEAAGLHIVDGLDMLIGQAIPSFEALFGRSPPSTIDARALLLAELDRTT